MIIAKKYTAILKNIKTYTDEEYLDIQLWNLKHMFYGEPSAIKNTKLAFIAFSNSFAIEFNLDSNCLGKMLQDTSTINLPLCLKIEKQEQKIIINKKPQDSIFHMNMGNQHIFYFMRKRPIINPSTGNTVGIIIFPTKFDPMRQRRGFIKNVLQLQISNTLINNSELNEYQQQIIMCLLLGFHQRKEIAAILNKATENSVNEHLIKNSLQTLYNKYSCNNINELINILSANEASSLNPVGMKISEDSYTITHGT